MPELPSPLPERLTPTGSLGQLLADARTRQGWSRTELARRLAVSPSAVAGYESGRPPRHSVLSRYCAVVPGLTADLVLEMRGRQPPGPCRAAWSELCHAHGVVARRFRRHLRVHGHQLEVEHVIEGLQPTAAACGPDIRPFLVVAACRSRVSATRRQLSRPASWETLELDDDDGHHVFRWEGDRLDYRHLHRERLDAALDVGRLAELAQVLLEFPVQRLELALESVLLRPEVDWRLFAWPPALGSEHENDLATYLAPEGTTLRQQPAALEASFTEALPYLRFGLLPALPRQGAERLAGAGPPREGGLGGRLRDLRERRRLSRRRLSEKIGCSHHVVSQVEAGSDPRWSTLRAYLEVFPELAAQDLIPGPGDGRRLALPELFDYLAQVHGLLADRVERHVVIDPRGHYQRHVRVTRLRSLRRRQGDLEIRSVLSSVITGNAIRREPQRIRTELENAKTRVIRLRDGNTLHRIRFPADAARDGVSYEGELASPRSVYAMDRETAHARGLVHSPIWQGTRHRVEFPTRELRMSLTFPPGYHPKLLLHRACSGSMQPHFESPELAAVPSATEPSLREDEQGRLVAELRVESPIVGLAHDITWALEV
ncbi:MAG: helix-turn-helix domain-containing protein [Acidobacteriota bacterium]